MFLGEAGEGDEHGVTSAKEKHGKDGVQAVLRTVSCSSSRPRIWRLTLHLFPIVILPRRAERGGGYHGES